MKGINGTENKNSREVQQNQNFLKMNNIDKYQVKLIKKKVQVISRT